MQLEVCKPSTALRIRESEKTIVSQVSDLVDTWQTISEASLKREKISEARGPALGTIRQWPRARARQAKRVSNERRNVVPLPPTRTRYFFLPPKNGTHTITAPLSHPTRIFRAFHRR
jgi:hypothetical protein